ncbi:Rv3654c family TadE-like protein [Nonomuraea sp. NPDC046570]|uniref:Rv3654c family TadE-like protein n=1 Tax=Nonomuraea sp. NPDC046570 TaxID=3155255 RepID=UPI0033F970CC
MVSLVPLDGAVAGGQPVDVGRIDRADGLIDEAEGTFGDAREQGRFRRGGRCSCRNLLAANTPSRKRSRVKDRGSATIWCVAVMGLVLMVGMTFAIVGAARVAHHRAQSAADLSALAAARRAFADPVEACAHAATLAQANGAVLLECAIIEPVAEVTTSVSFALPGLGTRAVTGHARAGPAEIDPGRSH